MKKLLLLLLSAAFLLTCFGGCQKQPNGTDTESGADSVTEPSTEGPYELPISNLDGAVISVLTPANKEWQCNPISSALIPEVVAEAMATRNNFVQNAYNCELRYIVKPGNATAFSEAMSVEMQTQDGAYDIVFTDYWWNLEIHGYFKNLMDYDEVALDQPWYLQGWNENATIKGHLTGAVGYFSTQTMSQTAAVFYNKDTYNSLFDRSLYEYVTAGQWDLATMMEMASIAQIDMNGGGMDADGVDSTDKYGIVLTRAGGRSLFYTAGAELFSVNEAGEPYYNYNTARNVDIFDKIKTLFNQEYLDYQVDYLAAEKIFSQGRALFALHSLDSGLAYRLVDGLNYGMIPFPKYDLTQTEYISDNQGCCYTAIPVTADNGKNSAIILNALHYYSYQFVKPVFFDTLLKVQVIKDPDASAMVDLVTNNIQVDFGFIYNNNLNAVTTGMMDIVEQNRGFVAYFSSMETVVNESLRILMTRYIDPNAA